MSYRGIDYSLGRSNVDLETGIHYGVISSHTVGQRWYDEAEADYGEPTCPKCGNAAETIPSHTESSDPPGQWVSIVQDTPEEFEDYKTAPHACGDYACRSCRYLFDAEGAFGDEPIGYAYEDSEYKLADCLDSDVFVFKSPYYTFAQFCSPCVPGAGNLDTPCEDGPKTYCLGHDWFETDETPYPVFRVSDNTQVFTEEK